jgi:hypothetical protein
VREALRRLSGGHAAARPLFEWLFIDLQAVGTGRDVGVAASLRPNDLRADGLADLLSASLVQSRFINTYPTSTCSRLTVFVLRRAV